MNWSCSRVKGKIRFILKPTVIRAVCPGVKPPSSGKSKVAQLYPQALGVCAFNGAYCQSQSPDRRSDSHLWSTTNFFFLRSVDSCGLVDVRRPLWREVGSVVYSCSWASPEQSLSCPSPAGLMTMFHSLNFETLQTWMARFLYLFPLISRLITQPRGGPNRKHCSPYCCVTMKVFVS
jgi:hypothetical protein